MKTIVLGFKDYKAEGKAELIAGPDINAADQIKIVNDAKHGGSYPGDNVRIELCIYEPRTIAIKPLSPTVKAKSKSK